MPQAYEQGDQDIMKADMKADGVCFGSGAGMHTGGDIWVKEDTVCNTQQAKLPNKIKPNYRKIFSQITERWLN